MASWVNFRKQDKRVRFYNRRLVSIRNELFRLWATVLDNFLCHGLFFKNTSQRNIKFSRLQANLQFFFQKIVNDLANILRLLGNFSRYKYAVRHKYRLTPNFSLLGIHHFFFLFLSACIFLICLICQVEDIQYVVAVLACKVLFRWVNFHLLSSHCLSAGQGKVPL